MAKGADPGSRNFSGSTNYRSSNIVDHSKSNQHSIYIAYM